ncbi:tRNA (adenine(58)-N(1))-methyltransferase catalytic subunit TRMT61A [Camellia lanceoleosa]|uniref:tRNA (Adenine(58)-N(1))-methyltransferase catalytic subunit TRMT61A n=1 Tax=Camellia lanceoleosa TaxID=1840588 RepID=A0ACC0HGY7_9ERIC|nr:tRNA (adenine(58)-N(1))-methyltransferase catalytic subunit TRMT61A [Camellia lanceoleosa]
MIRTQILYVADISFVIIYLELVPGCLVLESGTESGSCKGCSSHGTCLYADSVFLDLPQPWLAIPYAGKMLKQDGILCSFSPCIEQVQRSYIKTFEVLLCMYEVRERKTESFQADDSPALGSLPCKRRHGSNEGSNASSLTIMVRPSTEARGHTGYLTFARLGCLS